MARMTWPRELAAVGIALALALMTTACASPGESAEERLAQVVAAVKAADDRVTEASAEESVDGLSSGWTVDIVLSGSGPATSDELRDLLLAARHAGGHNPGHVDFFATDEGGEVVDLTAAADELGIRYSGIGSGIGATRDAIDDALGAGQ